MLAGQRSFRGLRRWSRLGKRCTQAQCPRPPGAALRPFLRPASVICGACCVCGGVLVTRAWAMIVVLQELRRACLHRITDANRPAPCPLREAPLPAHSAPPALRATGINIKDGVRGRRRGSGAGRWGRGQGEAVCVRAYMQAHTHFLVSRNRCNIEAIVQNTCLQSNAWPHGPSCSCRCPVPHPSPKR